MTQKNLAAFSAQGSDYIVQFKKFDYTSDKHLAELFDGISLRVNELNTALDAFKKELDGIWNAIYDLSSVDDIRHIHGRIEAILGSGLTEKDRDDLENIEKDIDSFLSQVAKVQGSICTRAKLIEECDRIKEQFEDAELDVEPAIDDLLADQLSHIDTLESEWIERFLTIVPEDMSQADLDKWKRDTQPLPEYISEESQNKHRLLLNVVEHELSKQRVDYILMLFNGLSDEEKGQCYQLMKNALEKYVKFLN